MFSPWNIPNVGEVQLSWLPNPPITLPTASTEPKNGLDEEHDTAMDTTPSAPAPQQPPRDMDYDVAEDDGWGA